MDPRIKKLANTLVNYSCSVQKGEKVFVSSTGSTSRNLVRQLIKEIYAAGGYPYYDIKDSSIARELIMNCSETQLQFLKEYEMAQMKGMDAYIAIRASDNTAELSDVPSEKINLYNKILHPVLEERVNHTKWVVLRYPNNAMAQLAHTSLEAFEDFYFNVCNLDYEKMSLAMDALVHRMEKTDKVHLLGPGTDLTFSITDIPVRKCDGERNIPDGEVYTAPVKDSVNGVLSYNTPSQYQGFTYEKVRFEFKNGKIIRAESNDTKRINELLDTDDGARYIGEFAIGVNPYILKPMKDTLFDEKIMGSFHFTPGNSYEDAFNGNKSAIHWDLVCIQTPEHGGGEMYFDDVLIRRDGLFVIPELEGLNPENLK